MDELFNIIGKLYVDISNAQKVLEMMRQQLQDKDQELTNLKKKLSNDIDE